MKLLCFNDYRIGVLKGANVVDITAVIQNIPHNGPGDLMNRMIERFADVRARIDAAVAAGSGLPVAQVTVLALATWGAVRGVARVPALWHWLNTAPTARLRERSVIGAAIGYSLFVWLDLFRTHVALPVAHDGIVHGLTRPGEVPRALPQAHVLEHRTIRHCPGMGGRGADRVEQVAAVIAGKDAEGDGRVVRAEHRGAHLGNADAHRVRGNRQAVDVAQLALVGAEAQRRVALDVFDRLEALAHREQQVGRGDVVLQVDELQRCARRSGGMWHQP